MTFHVDPELDNFLRVGLSVLSPVSLTCTSVHTFTVSTTKVCTKYNTQLFILFRVCLKPSEKKINIVTMPSLYTTSLFIVSAAHILFSLGNLLKVNNRENTWFLDSCSCKDKVDKIPI